MPYYTLRVDKGFLRGIRIGPDLDITQDHLREAEDFADAEIEEFLQKRWPIDDATRPVPRTLQKIAHMLGASYVLLAVHRNNLNASGLEYADKLEQRARETLADIRKGLRGIKLADGTWDPHYRGSWNREEGRGGGGLTIICG